MPRSIPIAGAMLTIEGNEIYGYNRNDFNRELVKGGRVRVGGKMCENVESWSVGCLYFVRIFHRNFLAFP